MQFILLLLALQTTGAPTPAAQKLSNAERRLESVVRTKEPTASAEAEVARLGTVWLLDEAKRAGSLELEARTGRFAELLRLAHKRGLKETEQRLEGMAKPVFESWLARTNSLFTPRQALRAVAYRRALMDQLPPASGLADLGQPIETRAAEWLALERSKANGDGAKYAFDVGDALLRKTNVSLPATLEKLTHAAGEVQVSTECEKATPSLARGEGVPAVQNAQIASCSESSSESSESRSAPWTETISEMVEKQEKYTTDEMETYTVLEQQNDTMKFRTNHVGSSGSVAYTTEEIKIIKVPVVVEKRRMVKVEHTRPIKVLEKRNVSRVEQFTVRVRTYVAAVRVRVVIEGDGQRVEREELVRGTAKEEEFTSDHGGQSRFTGAAQAVAMEALKREVLAYYGRIHREWVTQRGTALLARAVSLDQKVTAAVLLGTTPPAVEIALRDTLGMTAEESSHLVAGNARLTPSPAPTYTALELPPPEVGLKNDLETRELVIATVDMQGGYFGGLAFGAVIGEPTNGDRSPGFGGNVILGYRPGFSVRSHLLTRLIGQLQVGSADHLLVDGNVRVELGIQVGPLTLASLGVVQEVGAFHDGDPLVGAAGYGGRAQLSVEMFRAKFEASPAPVALGTELLVSRMHRASSENPIGTNVQATLFVDLGHIVKITLAAKGATRDDVPEFLSSETQRWFGGLGIQSDF